MISLIKDFSVKLQEIMDNNTDFEGGDFPIIWQEFDAITNNRRIEIMFKSYDMKLKGAKEYTSDGYDTKYDTEDNVEVHLYARLFLVDEGDTSDGWQNGILQASLALRKASLGEAIEFESGGQTLRATLRVVNQNGFSFSFDEATATKAVFSEEYELKIVFRDRKNNILEKVYNN